MKYQFTKHLRLADGDLLFRKGDVKELPDTIAKPLLERKMITEYQNKAIEDVENKAQG